MRHKAAAKKTTTVNAVSSVGIFGSALLDIGWRLAISVFIGLYVGTQADKKFGTEPIGSLLGVVFIALSFVAIVIRVLHTVPRSQGGLKND